MCYISSIARARGYDRQLNLVWFEPVRQRFLITQFCMEVNSVLLGFLIVGFVLFVGCVFKDRDHKSTAEKCLYFPCLIILLQWSDYMTRSGKGLCVA